MSKPKSTGGKNIKKANNQRKQRTSIGKSKNTYPRNKQQKRRFKPYNQQGR